MPHAITELAIGSIDASNKLFKTHRDYKAGSLVVYTNGFADAEPIELGGRDFELSKAPVVGEVITVYYRPI